MIDPAYNDLSNREPEYVYNPGFEPEIHLPSIDEFARNAQDLAPQGVKLSAGYIGNIEWAPRRDDRSWMIFRANGARAEGYPQYGMPSEQALREYLWAHAEDFARWVMRPMH